MRPALPVKSSVWGLLLLAALAAFSAMPEVAGADDQAKLSELRQRLDTLQQSLNEIRGREATVRTEIRDLERKIGELVHDLRATDEQLAATRRRLRELQGRVGEARQELAHQHAELAAYARAAYTLGRQPALKLVLNQQDPSAVARVLVYYRYFNEARVARIHAVQASLERLAALEDEIRAHAQELATLREAQSRRRQVLEAAHARRLQLLAHLKRQARSTAEEIERLRADERRLAELLGQLKSYLADLPSDSQATRRFGELRGRLALPVRGPLLARYGAPRGIGSLRWQGVWLAAHEGQAVHAVFRGRVAYADWLRGFGLLLILDHGDGYMTLYGHNQSLHKQVGDWVETGEVIAQAGSTGDAPRPGVYFEVRYNGEPRDPLLWCRAP